ncbi:MAG: hypothetical protein AB1806_09170 [Acidobacteriota bacterium]
MRRVRLARRCLAAGSDRGQAMTETVLMAWGLVLLIAVVVQVFLIDLYSYHLATSAHARLFARVAYPDNRPNVKYETRWTSKFEGRFQLVPLVAFFKPYGLTQEDLRIKTTQGRPGGFKRIKLGRGTQADAMAGIAGRLDPTALAIASGAWSDLELGLIAGLLATPPAPGRAGR